MPRCLHRSETPAQGRDAEGLPVLAPDEIAPGIALSRVPGLVGSLARHGAGGALRPTAVPAIVGALAGVSALMGPRWRAAFPDRLAAGNLYLLMIAPTGLGKMTWLGSPRRSSKSGT